jgi:thiol-disulfide isomerase/thioredoxin
VALAGFVYFALALGSLFLWYVGFDPYCDSGLLLGRPLLLWGAAAYTFTAALCFGGVERRFVLTGASFLAAFHAFFLALAWRGSGYLCPACASFFGVEAALAVSLSFARGNRRYPVLLALAAVVMLAAVGFLAYNPSVFRPVLHDDGLPAAEAVPVAEGGEAVEKTPKGPASADKEKTPEGQMAADVGQAKQSRSQVYNSYASKAQTVTKSVEAAVPQNSFVSEPQKDVKDPAVKGPSVVVKTADGRQAELELSRRPVLYFAWWCPACREVLKELAGLPPERRPYPVAVCFTPVDVSRSAGELAEVGLSGIEFYISRESPGGGLPALLSLEDGKAKTVNGKAAVLREIGKGEP